MLDLVKNWLQYAQNRVAWPTSITNSAFQMAIVAMPIDCAHFALCMFAWTFWKDIICPSCTIIQMQGMRGVCALEL